MSASSLSFVTTLSVVRCEPRGLRGRASKPSSNPHAGCRRLVICESSTASVVSPPSVTSIRPRRRLGGSKCSLLPKDLSYLELNRPGFPPVPMSGETLLG